MFEKYTYLLYTLFFTFPLILVLIIANFKLLKKNLKPILLTTVFITVFYGMFSWQIALENRLWWYGDDRILGITLLGTVIEDIIWWFLISFLISFFTIVAVKRVERFKK